jgi:hypothetical protein
MKEVDDLRLMYKTLRKRRGGNCRKIDFKMRTSLVHKGKKKQQTYKREGHPTKRIVAFAKLFKKQLRR